MLYCVSYTNGIVGIFSSLENIRKLVFDKYPSITFIIQAYKKKYENIENKAWIIMYKNSETCAYLSNDKNDIDNVVKIFNKIGKIYEDIIDYWEQDIDVISDCVVIILQSLQNVYGETGLIVDNSDNIIYY